MIVKWQIIDSTDKLNIGHIFEGLPQINDFVLLPSDYKMAVSRIESVTSDIMKLSNENYIIILKKI